MILRHMLMAPEGEAEGLGGGEVTPEVEVKVDETPTYDWRTDIHPDVKAEKVWESVPDIKTLTKSYADAVKYNVGAIKMPGKDATPEEVEAFHRKLGRPETVEGYSLPEPMKESPIASQMRPFAHAAGLTPAQWDKLTQGWTQLETEQAKSSAAQRDETVTTLQNEWGGAFDRKIGLMQRMIRVYGGEEVWQDVSTNPIGNNPGFLRMLAKLAEAMAEEELIDGTLEGTVSKESASDELDKLTTSEAYLKASHPGHAAAVKRATQLFELIYN